MSIHLGDGPCLKGHENTDILLTGETHIDEEGRTWWRCAIGQRCAVCEQSLDWMIEEQEEVTNEVACADTRTA